MKFLDISSDECGDVKKTKILLQYYNHVSSSLIPKF